MAKSRLIPRRLLEDIAKNYDHDAKWYDVDETVNKRLKD